MFDRRLVLVRHPDKEGDSDGIYVGNNARITDKGWRQVKLMLQRLDDMHPDLIISSELPRARALARALSERMNHALIQSTSLLNEIDKPQFLSGLSRKDPRHVRFMQEVRRRFDEDRVPDLDFVTGIWKDHADRPPPDSFSMHSRSDLEQQTAAFFERIEQYDPCYHTIVAVTHAKRIASFVHWVWEDGTLEGFYRKADAKLKLYTTGVTILTCEPDRHTDELHWHIDRVNDTSHEERAVTEDMRALLDSIP